MLWYNQYEFEYGKIIVPGMSVTGIIVVSAVVVGYSSAVAAIFNYI